jgi:HSP20 family molecular chaperone IbpA
MDRRVPINVSVTPSEYSGRSIRLGQSNNSDIRDKMNQRMREFEDESRKWREQFLSSSGFGPTTNTTTGIEHRPKMFVNFPEFPEFGTSPFNSSPLSSRFGHPSAGFGAPFPSASALTQSTHKSFIEEDDNGHKKYKMQFEIGDFKPNEIQVRTEGRQLVVKGDREVVAGTASESKQFNREITLPDFVEPTSVTSYLSEGILTVEAPVQLDRIGYSNSSNPLNNHLANSSSSTSSSTSTSTIRNSPFRDNSSPAKLVQQQQSSTQKRSSDLLNSSSASSSSFNNSTSHFSNESSNLNNNSNFSNTILLNNNNNTNNVSNNNSQPVVYKFNMSEFRPEDIAITVTDTTLKIHALREETDLRGNGKTYREFKREIGLPQGADVKRLKNSLQSDGTLTIEIPVQDNNNLRPPLSPTGFNKQFSNFSLNDNNLTQQTTAANTNSSLLSSSSSAANGGLIDQTNTGKELKLTFDLTGYKPEDLNIKVIDNNVLKVHAVHIDNTRGNQIHREYTRYYLYISFIYVFLAIILFNLT